VLAHGRAIGQKIGAGPVRVVKDASEMDRVQAGDVLVTDMTDPNWEPVMKRAAIVTNRGGRTCHAAIIARELGIPAIVGCGNATEVLSENEASPCPAPKATPATSTRQARLRSRHHRHRQPAEIPVKIMMNVGNPELAFDFAQLPNAGVGLARLEFIINNMIGIHPKAILEINQVPASLRDEIKRRSRGYASPKQFFVEKLVEGVATIAAAFYPKPVIVRLSDFKSNEYRKLLGGEIYEPEEENPMLGFRGASRYIAHSFRDCFEMECAR
jgi:pyruvate,water dikinase